MSFIIQILLYAMNIYLSFILGNYFVLNEVLEIVTLLTFGKRRYCVLLERKYVNRNCFLPPKF